MLKRCYKCGLSKELNEFYKDSTRVDGRSYRCITCVNKRLKETKKHRAETAKLNYLVKRDEKLAYSKQWSINNRDKHNERTRNYQANKRGQLGNVPKNVFKLMKKIYGTNCMNPNCTSEISLLNKLTIDHVVPLQCGTEETRLHDISNMQLLCQTCNSIKGYGSDIDFRPKFVTWDPINNKIELWKNIIFKEKVLNG